LRQLTPRWSIPHARVSRAPRACILAFRAVLAFRIIRTANAIDGDPAHYLNRELSWLQFNRRVLAEAASSDVPLFERVKFLGIFFSNLDEFFMVRVAGLQAQTHRTITDLPPDGLMPVEQLLAISARAHTLVESAYRLWNQEILPALHRAGIVLVRPDELAVAELAALDERFRTDIFPILTPLAIDPGHPFPHLRNKTINLGIMFSREYEANPASVIQVPDAEPPDPVRVEGAIRPSCC
jgi:polyphosphate kinase